MSDYKILQQPNVPKPLHSLAPRVIETAHWWKKQRDIMLLAQDMTCKCCDTKVDHRSKLDLHEEYTINYEEGYSNVTGMIGLCKDCHSAIHNGFLYKRAIRGEIDFNVANRIFRRAFTLLKGEGLEPNSSMAIHYGELLKYFNKSLSRGLQSRINTLIKEQDVGDIQQDWSLWHLRWKGKKYYSLFASMEDWRQNVGKRKYIRNK